MRKHRDFDFDFDPSYWFRGWKSRGRGKRRGNWFGPGDMKYVILKLLKDRPMHGYDVIKELEEKTRGCYKPSPGTVYPTLQWLEEGGLVEMATEDGKKIYSITDDGLKFLEDNKSTVEDIFDRVSEMIDRIFDDPGPDVSRAVGRLVGAAYRAAWKDGRDPERKKKIIEILDETTSRIETLSSDREEASV
jgi:DNA-binding PadR family transcriptional regulator